LWTVSLTSFLLLKPSSSRRLLPDTLSEDGLSCTLHTSATEFKSSWMPWPFLCHNSLSSDPQKSLFLA
jgi:hypothetical protein